MVQENSVKDKIIIICGPTASGKTALAVELAKLLDTEVVSADSMYIYKDLSIGTAKPSVSEMQGVVHHLIDVVDANQNFSVSDYREMALPVIKDIIKRGKTPIICGGTGFYINSILYNLSYGNSNANLPVREKYLKLAESKGNEYVYSILMEKDAESAKKLHFNDVKRVVRALEIYESGMKKSDIKDDLTPQFDYKAFMIDYPREELYKRINLRVDIMKESGLYNEIKGLIDRGITRDNQCFEAIGYKEILDYIDGLISYDDAFEKIKLNTRHYAKRQITFFKKYNLIKLQPDNPQILAKIITERYL